MNDLFEDDEHHCRDYGGGGGCQGGAESEYGDGKGGPSGVDT